MMCVGEWRLSASAHWWIDFNCWVWQEWPVRKPCCEGHSFESSLRKLMILQWIRYSRVFTSIDFITSVLQCIKGHIPGRIMSILQMFHTYQKLMFELVGEVAVKHLGFIGRRPVDVAHVVQVCNWCTISTEALNPVSETFGSHCKVSCDLIKVIFTVTPGKWLNFATDVHVPMNILLSKRPSCLFESLPLHLIISSDSQVLCFLALTFGILWSASKNE